MRKIQLRSGAARCRRLSQTSSMAGSSRSINSERRIFREAAIAPAPSGYSTLQSAFINAQITLPEIAKKAQSHDEPLIQGLYLPCVLAEAVNGPASRTQRLVIQRISNAQIAR